MWTEKLRVRPENKALDRAADSYNSPIRNIRNIVITLLYEDKISSNQFRASWYEWNRRTDISVLGGQTLQIDLVEEGEVSPIGSEQMSLF